MNADRPDADLPLPATQVAANDRFATRHGLTGRRAVQRLNRHERRRLLALARARR